ncbi:hypothetical protein Tco_1276073 [Tanacetum coccineum]
MDEKAREEKIRQNQADDKYFMKFGVDDEYLTEGSLTEKELHQLALDEEALREALEEEAQAEKERARAEKEWEEEMKKEEAHNVLFMLEFWVTSDSEYETH